MKIVLAPDSFKGSLSALEIVTILARTVARVFPGAQAVPVPVADGGEGTVDALVLATGGTYREAVVSGPLGERVTARYGLLPGGRTAVLEMAQASGLPLMPPGGLDPLRASSRGTGELLLSALDAGARDILLGIGGSATNDGGMGFLSALGARFTDADGQVVPDGGQGLSRVFHVDLSGLDRRLGETGLRVICDVSNPLLGGEGATHVYGPQKGVTPALLERLEQGMEHYARVMEGALGRDIASAPGAGAAGGMGAALHGVLGARLLRGVDAVLEAASFDALLENADLCITAEGRMDGQSIAFGKVPVGVAARCREKGVPVVAIVGGMTEDAMAFLRHGDASIMTTINAAMRVEDAMQNAESLMEGAAERMLRLIDIGRKMGRGNG